MAEIVDFGLQQHKIKMDSRYFENVLSVVAGDTGRRLEVQLLDTNGMVQDTTGLNLRLNAIVEGKATYTDAALVDAETGKYQLDLSNGMFLAPGDWQFQWQITDSVGKKLYSFAFTGNVGKNISEGGVEATNFYLNAEELRLKTIELETRYQAMINYTTGKDVISAPEIIAARKGETSLNNRLTKNEQEVTAQLAQTIKKEEGGVISYAMLGQDAREQITGGNTAVVGVDAVLEENLVNGAVSLRKTNFYKRSSNIHDKTKEKQNVYIDVSNGQEIENTTFISSGLSPIKAQQSHYLRVARHIAYYSSENVNSFISGYAPKSDERQHHVFVPSESARYVRYSWSKADITEPQQLNESSVRLPYEEFYEIIDKNFVEKHSLTVDELPAIPLEKMDFAQQSSNLFNMATVKQGVRIDANTGKEVADVGWTTSAHIPIQGLTPITIKHTRQYAIYDAGGVRIQGGAQTGELSFISHANAKTFRFSWYPPNDSAFVTLDNQQVNIGNKLLPFEKFGYKISSEVLDTKKEDFLLFLPSEIYVAVGRTIELYNKQVAWGGNINNYHFKWDCKVGKPLNRKFSVKGTTETIGDYPLTLTVYDNNMEMVKEAKTVVKIVSNELSTPIDLLTIGDSLTNSKAWLTELRTLSNGKITNVGTRGSTDKHEGRSGFFAKQYLEATSYEFEGEGVHPFWDGSRFNWNHYKSTTGINPDAVQIFLGTNNIKIDPTENATAIKQMVDYIRQDDAVIPIYVVFTLYRGNQDGLGVQTSSDGFAKYQGAFKLEEDKKVFNLMVRLNELLKGYSKLSFVPLSLAHDSEYNFGAVETPVNPRATQIELMPSEAIHPQTQGYLQMADIMFSVMVS